MYNLVGGYTNDHEKAMDLLKELYEYCYTRDACSECIFFDSCEWGVGIFTDQLREMADKRLKELSNNKAGA